MGPLPGGQTYIARNVPVRFMMQVVYGLVNDQVSGGPAWINAEPYDIEAKAERPGSFKELQEMFQNLLAERFHLEFHRETRQRPVYALTIDKNGPKLKANDRAGEFSGRIGPNIGSLPGMIAEGVGMRELCLNLAQVLGRPVLDKTGLNGYYDFRVQWAPFVPLPPAPDGSEGPPPAIDGSTIFNALREQLGLKLEGQKGPVDIFVIDRVERPSTN